MCECGKSLAKGNSQTQQYGGGTGKGGGKGNAKGKGKSQGKGGGAGGAKGYGNEQEAGEGNGKGKGKGKHHRDGAGGKGSNRKANAHEVFDEDEWLKEKLKQWAKDRPDTASEIGSILKKVEPAPAAPPVAQTIGQANAKAKRASDALTKQITRKNRLVLELSELEELMEKTAKEHAAAKAEALQLHKEEYMANKVEEDKVDLAKLQRMGKEAFDWEGVMAAADLDELDVEARTQLVSLQDTFATGWQTAIANMIAAMETSLKGVKDIVVESKNKRRRLEEEEAQRGGGAPAAPAATATAATASAATAAAATAPAARTPQPPANTSKEEKEEAGTEGDKKRKEKEEAEKEEARAAEEKAELERRLQEADKAVSEAAKKPQGQHCG